MAINVNRIAPELMLKLTQVFNLSIDSEITKDELEIVENILDYLTQVVNNDDYTLELDEFGNDFQGDDDDNDFDESESSEEEASDELDVLTESQSLDLVDESASQPLSELSLEDSSSYELSQPKKPKIDTLEPETIAKVPH